jgi:outer membrane protein assembly factor BamA
MKIAIVTSLFTKRNMNIYTSHFFNLFRGERRDRPTDCEKRDVIATIKGFTLSLASRSPLGRSRFSLFKFKTLLFEGEKRDVIAISEGFTSSLASRSPLGRSHLSLLNIIVFVFFFIIKTTNAQSVELEIIPLDKDKTFLKDNISYQRTHKNIVSLKTELTSIVEKLHQKSYWSASIDSLTQRDSLYTIYIYVGEKIKWAELDKGNLDDMTLAAIGFRARLYENKPFSMEALEIFKQRILTYCENNGYPFARIRLDSIQVEGSNIKAKLFLEKKRFVQFEALKIEGDGNLSISYLENYLGIREGMPYSESLLQQVSGRLRAIPFIKEKRGLAVIFKGNKAEVTLFLDKRNASRFDLIVGFLPQNSVTGRPLLTGSFQGVLQNPFGTGKTIGVDWQRLKAQTSRLQANFSYPYIFNLPFGFDGKMDIYRRDSTLQDTKFDVGMQYLFAGNNYVKIFWKSTANNTLTINEQAVISTRKLPNNLDILNTTLGVEYSYQQLNNRINPQKGFSVRLQGGAGVKQIRQSALIGNLIDENQPDFDFITLYDSLSLRTFQVSGEASLAYYQPIGERFTIKGGLEGGLIFSQDSLYGNEIYRIGGNRLLRGFDEESVLASAYAVLTIEPRLLLNETSYLFAFLDYAYLQNLSIGNQVRDFPLGFGLGLSLSTPAGIVRVSYAVGQQLEQPIDFRVAKIHFGYVNYF